MTFLTLLALGIAGARRRAVRRASAPPPARRGASVRAGAPRPADAAEGTTSRAPRRSLRSSRSAPLRSLALALLGASPLVKCSRLALSRSGTSVAVAIVLDDSMSMRVVDASGRSRFQRAQEGAREILGALRDGDAAAIVLAGVAGARGLAATTDVSAARAALDGIAESDRATDLDGAIAIARTLVSELPQIDRRVIVLSDLADGKPDAPPLGEGVGAPGVGRDARARARPPTTAVSSPPIARAAARAFASHARRRRPPRGARCRSRTATRSSRRRRSRRRRWARRRSPSRGDETRELVAQLTGKDAIASDDRALVVVEAGPAALAVVGDRTEEAVATGGAPVVEQALAALHVDMAVRPIPQVPDRREDTAPFAAIIVDDPPGFTPEQRHALGAFVESGGVLLVALGRRAAAAPLGANFEPFLAHAVGLGLVAGRRRRCRERRDVLR